MKLKEYQARVLEDLRNYLEALKASQTEYETVRKVSEQAARFLHPPRMAWEKATGKINYHERKNGAGEPVADIFFKIPTGGGKTFLACHSIDLIQRILFERQTGMVLWIVPSTEIYRQTARALKDRRHPYRQMLDVATANRVRIVEKDERFTPADVGQSLVILLLMLPSANRENKQSLRIFRDSGGFDTFFPPEDQWTEQERMLKEIPNLDCFGDEELAGTGQLAAGRQIMTSLGNALRVCKPIIVLDEGHKAYSERARDTIANMNPRFILQLSATPPPAANKLVEISGRDLDREQMIKLDIHLHNKVDNPDWKDTLLTAVAKRNNLEETTVKYHMNGGHYIRPICLIQVEQTGQKLVNDLSRIHARHAEEYLMKSCGIPPEHIAVKTSENDGLEGIDLLSEDCQIRYIITKQALQEGWDCPFAYVLAILSNSGSETGLTQLIGRILRQPYAQKTGIQALDECYVYTFRQSSTQLANSIKANLEKEGLGDIAGRLVEEGSKAPAEKREAQFREQFKRFEGQIYLPKFVVPLKDGSAYRDFIYEADILPEIDWGGFSIEEVLTFNPGKLDHESKTVDADVGYREGFDQLSVKKAEEAIEFAEIDLVFMTRQLTDVMPNPWWGYDYSRRIVEHLKEKFGEKVIASNFIRLIQWTKNKFRQQLNVKAKEAFERLLDEKRLLFLLLKQEGGYYIPNRIKVSSGNMLHHGNNMKVVQKSLFDYEPDDEYNGEERALALYLDKHERLLWWHRNRVGDKHYNIKAWLPQKVYPDFIAAKPHPDDNGETGKVFVLEYKGKHLKDNEDTVYKREVLELCNRDTWEHLSEDFPGKKFTFQMIYQDEYEQMLEEEFA